MSYVVAKYHYFQDRKQICAFAASIKSCCVAVIFQNRKQILLWLFLLLLNDLLWQISLFQKIEKQINRKLKYAFCSWCCCGKYHYFKDRKQILTSLQWTFYKPLRICGKYHSENKSCNSRRLIELWYCCCYLCCVVANLISKIEKQITSPYKPAWCGKYHYFKIGKANHN